MMDYEELVAIEKEIWALLLKRDVSLQDAKRLFTRLYGHVDDTITSSNRALPEYENIKSRYKHD